MPLPQDESWITDLLGQRRVQQHQHLDERDLHLGLAGGFAISTFISAVRNRRFRSETERRIRDMKRKYVELRNRMPLDQTEIRETYWDEMDEFFADEKLVECMKYNLGVEDDVRGKKKNNNSLQCFHLGGLKTDDSHSGILHCISLQTDGMPWVQPVQAGKTLTELHPVLFEI